MVYFTGRNLRLLFRYQNQMLTGFADTYTISVPIILEEVLLKNMQNL